MDERFDQTHDLVDEGDGVDYVDFLQAARVCVLGKEALMSIF